MGLVAQCSIIVGAMLESEKHRGVQAVRRFEWEIRAKMASVAIGAWISPMWWLFDLTYELRGEGRLRRQDDPPDSGRAAVVVVMFFFHIGLALLVGFLAMRGGNHLLAHMLRPVVLWSRRFDAVPEDQVLSSDGRCAICLTDFEASDPVLLLPCRHLFHADCLAMWLKRSELCPMRCRGAVFQPSLEPQKRHQLAEPAARDAAQAPPELESGAGDSEPRPAAGESAATGPQASLEPESGTRALVLTPIVRESTITGPQVLGRAFI